LSAAGEGAAGRAQVNPSSVSALAGRATFSRKGRRGDGGESSENEAPEGRRRRAAGEGAGASEVSQASASLPATASERIRSELHPSFVSVPSRAMPPAPPSPLAGEGAALRAAREGASDHAQANPSSVSALAGRATFSRKGRRGDRAW